MNDDDDIVNQNSSHDGRSNGYTSMQIEAHEVEIMSEQPQTPLLVNERVERDVLRQPPQAQLNREAEERKSRHNEVNLSQVVARQNEEEQTKLPPDEINASSRKDGPNLFSYFSASSLSDDRWCCPICLEIFEDAVETSCCNNLFCEKCIKMARTCPLCNKPMSGHLKPNIPIRRLVLELNINCPNNECKSIVRRCDQERHISDCDFTPVACPNNVEQCGLIKRKNLETHVSEICAYRLVDCLLNCGGQLVQNDMDMHIRDECKKTELECRNQCGQIVERGEMEHHLNVQCGLQELNCPNKGESLFEEGCNAVIKRKDLE